jgi:hypothetical protein
MAIEWGKVCSTAVKGLISVADKSSGNYSSRFGGKTEYVKNNGKGKAYFNMDGSRGQITKGHLGYRIFDQATGKNYLFDREGRRK